MIHIVYKDGNLRYSKNNNTETEKMNELLNKMENETKENILNGNVAEDFETRTVVQGTNREVSPDADAPKKPTVPPSDESQKSDNSNGGADKDGGNDKTDAEGGGNGGGEVIADTPKGGNPNGLSWFSLHWKEIAITGAALGLLALLVSAVKKIVSKNIKIRYNKVVKSLQRAQRDFTCDKRGLNMRNILPGVGSSIMDKIANLWNLRQGKTKGNKSAPNTNRGNIGLYPFCDQYKDETAADFRSAVEAFNKIKLANENASESVKESNAVVYKSFKDAYSSHFLNEGVSEDKINESVIATMSSAIALASLAARAGSFVMHMYDKDGKPVKGSEKTVQVTQESTREVLCAIINNFATKYINMDGVFKAIGIDTKSLQDLDKSSVDKLAAMMKKYSAPDSNNYNKQYSKVKSAYQEMLDHYINIGNGIIENFIKYSEAKDEKHANLIVASKEKLQNMWDSQKRVYADNFTHIITEIVSDPTYLEYVNFIVGDVLPAFKSGIAGDADYVLDIVPKKGEYYLVRQTENQPWLKNGVSDAKGKVAIVEVIDFNRDSQSIDFKLIGALDDKSGDAVYDVDENGYANITDNSKINFAAYKDNGKDIEYKDLKYGKWLALDPIIMSWTPQLKTDVYVRYKNYNSEYLYGVGSVESNTIKTIYYIVEDNTNKVIKYLTINVKYSLYKDDFEKLCNDLNLSFYDIPEFIKKYISRYKSKKEDIKTAKSKDDIINIINEEDDENKKEDEGFLSDIDSVAEQISKIKVDVKNFVENDGNTKLSNDFPFKYYNNNVDNGNPYADVVAGKDENGNDINLRVYVALAHSGKNEIDINDSTTYHIVYYIYKDKKYHISCFEEEKYIKSALEKLKTSVDENKDVDDDISKTEINILKKEDAYQRNKSYQNKPSIKLTKDVANFVKMMKIGLDKNKDGSYNVNYNILNTDDGNVSIKDLNGGGVIRVELKDIEIENGVPFAFVLYLYKLKNLNENDLYLLVSCDGGANKQKVKIEKKGNDISYVQNLYNFLLSQYNAMVKQNSSIEISYFIENIINESNVSKVMVNRHFDEIFKNYYILSESYYDESKPYKSLIGESWFVNGLNTRKQCTDFVKSKINANLCEFKYDTSFVVESINGTTPKLHTPLYESIILIKFDDEDNIIDKVNIGKNKIA